MRRALLIGSQTFGLQGVHNDLDLMGKTLEKMEFNTTVCLGADASRKGILAFWSAFADRVTTDDTLVVYYSGHGGKVKNPLWQPGSNDPLYRQFIVPTDMQQGSGDDFRGILDLELAILLSRLTGKCDNVTVLLDCCHAAQMVRSARGRVKALSKPWADGVEGHLKRLSKKDLPELLPSRGNRQAVRLAATARNQSAYEDPGEGCGGFFTEVLAEALDQVGSSPVSWGTLGRWVREQVLVMEPRQRPELEGPVDRLLFQAKAERRSGLTFYYGGEDGRVPSLRGGRLHGVQRGNLYSVEKPGNPKEQATTARVTSVGGSSSRVALEGGQPLTGASVRPIHIRFPKRPVHLEDGVTGALRDAVNRSPILALATSMSGAAMARVRANQRGMFAVDEAGLATSKPIREPGQILTQLHWMAHALILRELQEEPPILEEQCFQLDWGRVTEERKADAKPLSGTLLNPGDRLFIRITNRGSEQLYVNLFNIGLSRRVTLLNGSARSGREIAPGETWCYGYREGEGLIGVPLRWPSYVPAEGSRMESIVAIIAGQPMDLSVLEGKEGEQRTGNGRSELEKRILGRCLGGWRTAPGEEGEAVAYAIRHIDFEVSPWPT